jgi:protein required for attachment to host cells
MYDFSDFKEQEEKAKSSNEQPKAEVKETREIANTITKEEKKPSHGSSKSGVSRDAISSSKDQTQEEILKQLKQINWGIRVGFLFIMLVVTGIIKPGIFG